MIGFLSAVRTIGRVRFGLLVVLLLLAARSPMAAEDNALGCNCVGTTGNVNCDYRDEVTIADVSLLIDHLYINFPRLPNREEANVNGDPEGEISIADVSLLIDHLFINFPPLPDCPKPPNAPPETVIRGFIPGLMLINAPVPGVKFGAGLHMRWEASDLIDHPYYPPPFECEWRLYGPYTDSLLDLLIDSCWWQVFRLNDGSILRYGLPPDTVYDTIWLPGGGFDLEQRLVYTHFVVCDTIWDHGVRQIICDTVLVDTIYNNVYGVVDTLLDVEGEVFQSNPDFNRLVEKSFDGVDEWTTDTRDSLFDVCRYYPDDTTRAMNFIFWVRARDPVDPTLYDPTPAFVEPFVVDPQFEHDVLVINGNPYARENKAYEDSLRTFWEAAIDQWAEDAGLSGIVDYDSGRDFHRSVSLLPSGQDMLKLFLKYKIMVVAQDAVQGGVWSYEGDQVQYTFSALGMGVNVWLASRCLGYHSDYVECPAVDEFSANYQYFFGVERYHFPGWGCGLRIGDDGYGYGLPRVEDFVGAYSQSPAGWPELEIDSTLLHTRYVWAGSIDPPAIPLYPWVDTIAALPQVGYVELLPEAEVLYTYKSKYGEPHPIWPEREFEGKPVMSRLDRGFSRTVLSLFTPLAIEETSAQIMVDSVLNWLYDPSMTGAEPAPDRASKEGGVR